MAKIAASKISGLLRSAQAHEKDAQWLQAEQIYRQVLSSYPARIDVNTALLNGLIRGVNWPAAELQAKALIATDAQSVAGWLGLAHALLAQNKTALSACESATRVARESAVAHDFLGVALRRANRHDDAVNSFQRALKIQPDAPGTLVNLANTLKSMGRLQEAIRYYQKALALDPHSVQALFNLGAAWQADGHFSEAKDCFYKVLSKAPNFADAHNSLGLLYMEQCQLPQAAQAFAAAIRLAPTNSQFRLTQLISTLAMVPANADEAAGTLQAFDAALEAHIQWRAQCKAEGRTIDSDTLCNLPFLLAYRQGNQMARLSRFADGVQIPHDMLPIPARAERPKIRLGVVSHHFRSHSVWDVVVKGLVQNIDRSRFELFLYHLGYQKDEETALAESLADVWKDTQTTQGAEAWAHAIADDQLDALFYPEIGMEPITYLLARQRLAPLQLVGWGHPITTGLDTIDGYCSGELLEPEDAQEHYRERLIRLPGTGCCTTPVGDAAQPIDEVLAMLQGPGPVLLLAQMPFKLDPQHDAVLAKIAKGLGPCKIVIPRNPKVGLATDLLVQRLNACLKSHDVDPQAQIVAIPWLQKGQFKSLLQSADVYLDCPSFSGYTTAWTGAHTGIPIVCWDGPFMRQRLAAGLLKRMGITDTIATTLDDYVAIAIALAQENPTQRQQRRSAIMTAATRLDGDLQVVRAFEEAVVRGVESGIANPHAL